MAASQKRANELAKLLLSSMKDIKETGQGLQISSKGKSVFIPYQSAQSSKSSGTGL